MLTFLYSISRNIKLIKGVSLLFLLIFVWASFSPTLNNDFVKYCDDDPHLLENPHIQLLNMHNVAEMFKTTINKTYIPLTLLSFSIEYHFFKDQPIVYHVTNLMLHLFVVFLIFIFAQQYGNSIFVAFMAALIFGVHPMHVESVAWITERKDVLYSVFYMLALVSYAKYLKSHALIYYWITLPMCLLSVLSKSMALSLPLALFLCDWLFQRKWTLKSVLEKIPHFICVIPIAWVTYSLNVEQHAVSHVLMNAILIWVWSFAFYIQKFLLPLNFVPLYYLPKPVSLLNSPYGLSLLMFISVMFILLIFRKKRWLIFSFLFYFATIFFLLRFDEVLSEGMVSDRYMYLPSLGFCIYGGVLLENAYWKIGKRNILFKRLAGVLIALFIFTLSFKTYNQCKIWKDSKTLFTHIIRHTQESVYALNNRGVVHRDRNEMGLAFEDISQALSFSPQSSEIFNNRGVIYKEKGEADKALEDFNQAIQLNPDYSDAYFNRGNLFKGLKKYDLAIDDFRKALNLNPSLIEAHNNLGNIFLQNKEFSLALESYQRALSLNPKHHHAMNNKGVVYLHLGFQDMAKECFDKALIISSDYADAYFNRGNFYFEKRNYSAALEDYDQAITGDPQHAKAFFMRSRLYKAMDDFEKALQDANQAVHLGFDVPKEYFEEFNQTNEKK